MNNDNDNFNHKNLEKDEVPMLNRFVEGFTEELAESLTGEKGKREAYENGYEEGVQHARTETVAILYDAGIEDKKIIGLLNKHWGLNMNVATDMLINEKGQAVIREVRQFLKLQGYSDSDIKSFMWENRVGFKIRRNPELLKLKDNPKKVIEAIKKSNSNK